MFLTLSQSLTRKLFKKHSSQQLDSEKALAPAQAAAVKLFERFPPLHKMPPAIARAMYLNVDKLFTIDRISLDHVKDIVIPVTLENGHDLKIRAYTRHAKTCNKGKPALVYFHGGGCAIGSIESHDRFCRFIAEQSDYTVLSVDYRLGPEYKFPTAIEDAITSWNWVIANARELNIDPRRTGVGGDSAGAYLSTLISVLSKNSSPELSSSPISAPAYQWLIYPMLDLRGTSDSYRRCNEGMLLTQDLMNYFRDHYLNSPIDRENPLASPLLFENLSDLPPTYILTAGHDPLMDDGLTFAERLSQTGTRIAHQHFQHLMHGFISFGGICPFAFEAMQEACKQLVSIQEPQ